MRLWCLRLVSASLLGFGLSHVAASYSTSPISSVVVVGGTHGNEYTGVWCIKALEEQRDKVEERYPSLTISTLLANPQAHLENKRFIDTDLNREFTMAKLRQTDFAGMPTTIESLRAKELEASLLLSPS